MNKILIGLGFSLTILATQQTHAFLSSTGLSMAYNGAIYACQSWGPTICEVKTKFNTFARDFEYAICNQSKNTCYRIGVNPTPPGEGDGNGEDGGM